MPPSQAQPAQAPPSASSLPAPPFFLRGRTLDGLPYDSAGARGKVLLVFYWRSDSAVCRSKLPELRANAAGWQGKAFELVLVSLDRQRADAAAYERTVALLAPSGMPHPSLWRGEAGYQDSLPAPPSQVPTSLLVDGQGRLVERFEGRIPPAAWDRIADLMP